MTNANTSEAAFLSAGIVRKSEQALAAVAAARTSLAKAASTDATVQSLNSDLLSLAEAEGAAHVWTRLAKIAAWHDREGLEFGAVRITDECAAMMESGADDHWSGRGNDLRRARFDGIRAACQQARWLTQ